MPENVSAESIETRVKTTFNNTLAHIIDYAVSQIVDIENSIDVNVLRAHLTQFFTSIFIYEVPEDMFEDVLNSMATKLVINNVVKREDSNIYVEYTYDITENVVGMLCVYENSVQTCRMIAEDELLAEIQETRVIEDNYKTQVEAHTPDIFTLMKQWIEEVKPTDEEIYTTGPYAKYLEELYKKSLNTACNEVGIRAFVEKLLVDGSTKVQLSSPTTSETTSWDLTEEVTKVVSFIQDAVDETELHSKNKDFLVSNLKKLFKK